MRALTLWQPWADAIIHYGKRIENRKWKPPHNIINKRIAIHAGKKFDHTSFQSLRELLERTAPIDLEPKNFPLGAVIGVARVIGWTEKSDSPWFAGPIGWVLDDVFPLTHPVPAKGALGLWDTRKELEAKILMQL